MGLHFKFKLKTFGDEIFSGRVCLCRCSAKFCEGVYWVWELSMTYLKEKVQLLCNRHIFRTKGCLANMCLEGSKAFKGISQRETTLLSCGMRIARSSLNSCTIQRFRQSSNTLRTCLLIENLIWKHRLLAECTSSLLLWKRNNPLINTHLILDNAPSEPPGVEVELAMILFISIRSFELLNFLINIIC